MCQDLLHGYPCLPLFPTLNGSPVKVRIGFPTGAVANFTSASQKHAPFSLAIGALMVRVRRKQATLTITHTTDFLAFSLFSGSATPGTTFDLVVCLGLARSRSRLAATLLEEAVY
jgi:hypothetical protein